MINSRLHRPLSSSPDLPRDSLLEWETGKRLTIATWVTRVTISREKLKRRSKPLPWHNSYFSKAALVDHEEAVTARRLLHLVTAGPCCGCFQHRRPAVIFQDWRGFQGTARDPLKAFWQTGYLEHSPKKTGPPEILRVSLPMREAPSTTGLPPVRADLGTTRSATEN